MDIKIDLFDINSIKNAKKQLTAFNRKLKTRTEKLAKRLAEFGAAYARDYFDSVVYDIDYYDGEPLEVTNIYVSVEGGKTEEDSVRYTINAMGTAIAFIEFGAGVHFNGSGDPYHETRPEGIVGIGEYGQHRGRQQSWSYKGADGHSRRTSGTPEQPGMWLTVKEMRSKLEELAKEVFSK